MPKSTKAAAREKPRKPRPDFPLYPHATGRWAKRVRGKISYFGKIADDPEGEAALNRWLDERDDLLAGRKPRRSSGGVTVLDAANHFLSAKETLRDSGEIAPRTFDRLYETCKFLLSATDKRRPVADLMPDDFVPLRAKMAKRWGPVTLGNEIQNVRSMFRHAYESGLIDKPVRFGPGFDKPSAKTLRVSRALRGSRLLSPEQIHAALAKAPTNSRAMILLGVNAGLGNTDLALLPITALDLDGGWLDYARTKTGVPRRIPLWLETVTAIRDVLRERKPLNDDDAALLLIGGRGQNYIGKHKGYRVHGEITRVFKNAGIAGHSFYDLRHTFSTIAEGARDLPAAQSIMGHAASGSDMAARYREGVSDERLKAVTDHVRGWLWPKPAGNEKKSAKRKKKPAV